MSRSLLLTSAAGVRHEWEDDGQGGGLIHSSQDVAPVLEMNKAMATHNDGYNQARDWRRTASIPWVLIEKWRAEDGVDVFKPENAAWLMRKLNSSEYGHLRTDQGQRLGLIDGGGAFR